MLQNLINLLILLFFFNAQQAGDKHYHPTCARCARCEQMFAEGEEMYLQGKSSFGTWDKFLHFCFHFIENNPVMTWFVIISFLHILVFLCLLTLSTCHQSLFTHTPTAINHWKPMHCGSPCFWWAALAAWWISHTPILIEMLFIAMLFSPLKESRTFILDYH